MLGSAAGPSEVAGLEECLEEKRDTTPEPNPVPGDLGPHHFAAETGGDVGAVDAPQEGAAWETGSVTGVEASGRG